MSREKIYVIGHKKPDTDSICSAIAYAQYKNQIDEENKYVPARAGEINPETEYVLERFETKTPDKIRDARNKKIILVDHNEISQSVDGLEDAEIMEVLDHHRIAGLETQKPIYFHTEPIGSTSTMVSEKFLKHESKLSKNLAGLLLSAILSDTVIHRSPTNTKKDERIAKELSEIIGLDIEEYGKEMLKKKSEIGKKNPREIVLGDFKEYQMTDKSVGIGQVETVTPEEVMQKKQEILEEMQEIIKEEEYDLLILLVTDLLNEDTEAFVKGDTEEFRNAFDVKIEEESAFLKNVLSRKKQVVPKLEKQFK